MYDPSIQYEDPGRTAPPEDCDVDQKHPELYELFETLECDIIFWEAFSADCVEYPYPAACNNSQHQKNKIAELDFQADVLDMIVQQKHEDLGRFVQTHMLDYAEKIWKDRHE